MTQQVVVWGHKLYSHTHSYIHGAFVKAFQHLGYKTLWLDNQDDVSTINFENTLFLTEGQVDSGIPIRSDCYYVLHNCDMVKYREVTNTLIVQVYTDDVIDKHGGIPLGDGCFQTADCLYIPWATDLLPAEIDQNIRRELISTPVLNFVGMMIEPWDQVRHWCDQHQIAFREIGGFSNRRVDFGENQRLIQESWLAPAVQNRWQVEKGYIPCRIFKNISYGKMGMTNSARVQELFGGRLLYHSNIHELMRLGAEFENRSLEEKRKILVPLMEYVRDHHTYLNRVELLLRLIVR
jgi:hypothetical protein